MRAGLIAVGTELLGAGRGDTNGDWLTDRLERLGVTVGFRTRVGDEVPDIALLVRHLQATCDVIILTGGLGPTEDDRTREGIARALGVPVERDEAMVDRLKRRYARRGYPFRDDQARQADRPKGTEFLDNGVGAAPGLFLEAGKRLLFALPGVPPEMKAMFESGVEPVLERITSLCVARRVLHVAGRTESSVDQALRDLYGKPGTTVTILAGVRGVELHLRSVGRTAAEARRLVDRLDAAMSDRLGSDLFGRDGATLAEAVGRGLERASLTLAAAESCTAGLLAGEITRVAGSSTWFRGGAVVYSDDLKVDFAGVRPGTLAEHGAVSAPVARELADGIRRRCGADLGVGITGIAGPGGGTADKPVGLVHWAIHDGRGVREGSWTLPGDRALVRKRTVTLVLDQMRRFLLERSGEPGSPEAPR